MDAWHKKARCCFHCSSEEIDSIGITDHGYKRFRCLDCRRTFNDRSGSPFNRLEIQTDVALQAVRWYLRYKLSYKDLAEMFLERGFAFTHEIF